MRHLFVISIFAAVIAVAIAGLIPAVANNGSVTSRFSRHPQPYATTINGSDPNAILSAVNTNTSGGGIIGQVGPSLIATAAGAGVYGVFNASSGVGEGVLGFATNGSGVIAESFGGTAATMYSQNYSPFAGPAVQGVSNGNAVVGISADTNSVVGITNAVQGSTSFAGLLGEDLANSGLFNNGVLGTTTNGGYGVEGTSTDNALGGVAGIGTSGDGVAGFSTSNSGVFGQSQAVGVFGKDTNATVPGSISTNVGVEGSSTNTNGVYGFSTNRNAAAFENSNGGFYTLFVQADNSGGSPFAAVNSSSGASMTFDSGGNLTISGTIRTAGSCSVGCAAARRVMSYAPTQTQPTMEDFGEGQLVNGYAHVNLDSAFANVIDAHTNYLVFVTPEGDSNGVYVTQKSSNGFTIRENRGGHSNMAFSYRIVAKPFGSAQQRLPMVDENTRMAAMRAGASDPRALRAIRANASLPVRHWSAFKQAVHDNPWLAVHGKVTLPSGPPANAVRAANRLRVHPR